MREVIFKMRSVISILTLVFMVVACTPLIGAYSPESYKYATSLKAETLGRMDKATEDYSEHSKVVDQLYIDLNKGYEYVKGVPHNKISTLQWDVLLKEENNLIDNFFQTWKKGGKASVGFIKKSKKDLSQAFDYIICLEANKKEPTECKKQKGSS